MLREQVNIRSAYRYSRLIAAPFKGIFRVQSASLSGYLQYQ